MTQNCVASVTNKQTNKQSNTVNCPVFLKNDAFERALVSIADLMWETGTVGSRISMEHVFLSSDSFHVYLPS